jgi:hypothetical protein
LIFVTLHRAASHTKPCFPSGFPRCFLLGEESAQDR